MIIDNKNSYRAHRGIRLSLHTNTLALHTRELPGPSVDILARTPPCTNTGTFLIFYSNYPMEPIRTFSTPLYGAIDPATARSEQP